MLPSAMIDRALERAPSSITEATRELLFELLDGKRLSKDQQGALSAIAERATAMQRATLPPVGGAAAEALGDNWFQCFHCAEVFEGEASACKICGRALAVARQTLAIELGGATLWLCPSDGQLTALELARTPCVLRVAWMRVEAGPRWFELLDEPGRAATERQLPSAIALLPNVSVVGLRDGGRTLLVHATKHEVHVVDGDVLRTEPDKQTATELAVRELTAVLYPGDAPEPPSGKAIAAKGHASNSALEAAILADPDRPETYLVYADWLQGQGDPRGELIVLDHARKTVEADRLRSREAAHFYGRLAPARHLLERFDSAAPLARATTWRWGFLESLWISNKRDHEGLDVEEALAAMLDHPSCRFLRDLAVGIVTDEDNSYDDIAKCIGERDLPTLRSLVLGDFYSEETELNWSHTGDLSPLYRAVPNLRRLTIRSGSLELGKIELPSLEALTVISGGLDPSALRSICNAAWPNLTSLSVQLGSESSFTLHDLDPILAAKIIPCVTHLGLGNSAISDLIATGLAASPIAAQLVSLDLSLGTLGDDGARALAAGAFPKLERIDVSESYLTEAGVAALSRIAKHVEVGEQREDDGDPGNRYIAAFE